MKPILHALKTVKKYGGIIEDYIDIHNFLDLSKSSHPDMRHRTILHNSLGCYIAEMLYGIPEGSINKLANKYSWSEEEIKDIKLLLQEARTSKSAYTVNSDGNKVSVRDIAEEHIIEDMGRIPTVSNYLDGMPMYNWLGGPIRKTTILKMSEEEFKNIRVD